MRLLISLLLLTIVFPALAQTTITAPMVAGCPSPVPNTVTNVGWPGNACKYQFYPLTDTTHAIASNSKTTPMYQHTYGPYVSTSLLVACPAGAILSADLKSCLDATGKDASVIVAKSAIPALSIVPIVPAGPDYTKITGYLIEQSYDAGATWDSTATLVNYPVQSASHCFRITAIRADGRGPPLVSCPFPK